MRHEFLLSRGVDIDKIAKDGQALALSELRMVFVAPLRSGDTVRGTMSIMKVTPARIVIDQRLMRLARTPDENEQVPFILLTCFVHNAPYTSDARHSAKAKLMRKVCHCAGGCPCSGCSLLLGQRVQTDAVEQRIG